MPHPLTHVVCVPLDLFGNAGTSRGAEIFFDAIKDLVDDALVEEVPHRTQLFAESIRFADLPLATIEQAQRWHDSSLEQALERIAATDEFFWWLGGNHLTSLPLYEAIAQVRPSAVVVQFDAHLDIYNLSDCFADLSHGNFIMKASRMPRLVNVGNRELVLDPAHIDRYFAACYPADKVYTALPAVIEELRQTCFNADMIYLDIDCDVFDAAFFPGLVEPRPFGLSPMTVLGIINSLPLEKIHGIAVSEYLPARDQESRSLDTLVWLFEYLMLRRYGVESA